MFAVACKAQVYFYFLHFQIISLVVYLYNYYRTIQIGKNTIGVQEMRMIIMERIKIRRKIDLVI